MSESEHTITYQFGPKWTAEGVEFTLWAPAADTVALVIEPDPDPESASPRTRKTLPLARHHHGWWRSTPQELPAGTAYSFLINGETTVPDPASRRQLRDVHGPSVLVAPGATTPWTGRPWEETVFYEVHTGAAGSPYSTFRDVAAAIPVLAETGITAVELMPIADFPGTRNWGYDGVLPFAPDTAYGTPDDLRFLVDTAHRHGVAIWLDVVYNHFGPEGNYLHLYAPQFFDPAVDTPWGAAIDFTIPQVRRFFIENALYWIHEFRFDGLRLDAVHAIHDPSPVHILNELAETVRASRGEDRIVHLVLENDRNEAHFLGSDNDQYTGQWNDDIHHAWHVLLTGESHGYYREYADAPEEGLARALATGYIRNSEASRNLTPYRFVAFVQNHDQIGNRAFGERLTSLAGTTELRAAVASLLLSPQIPLLFMGELWGARDPFQFFCDFGPELSRAVQDGRRREFGLHDLPDPTEEETYRRSCCGAAPPAPAPAPVPTPIDRSEYREKTAEPAEWLEWYRTLLQLRLRHLVPILPAIQPGTARGGGDRAVAVVWEPGWALALNLGSSPRPLPEDTPVASGAPWRLVFDSVTGTETAEGPVMSPWSVRAYRRIS